MYYVLKPYEGHVFIISILEMEKLKYITEVKQLAQVAEKKLEPRTLETKDVFLNHCALLPASHAFVKKMKCISF